MTNILKNKNFIICKTGSEFNIYGLLRNWYFFMIFKEFGDGAYEDVSDESVQSGSSEMKIGGDSISFIEDTSSEGDASNASKSRSSDQSDDPASEIDIFESTTEFIKNYFINFQTDNLKMTKNFKKSFKFNFEEDTDTSLLELFPTQAFHQLKLSQIASCKFDIKNIEKENIIPKTWINQEKVNNWNKLNSWNLSSKNQIMDKKLLFDKHFGATKSDASRHQEELAGLIGSTNEILLPVLNEKNFYCTQNLEDFFEKSFRFGRVLVDYREKYLWHWSYFTFGINFQYSWDIGVYFWS